MASQSIALEDLGHVSQGITLSRYASKDGAIYRTITVSDLENLYIKEVHGQAQLTSSAQRHQLSENDVVIAIRGTLLKSSVVTAAVEGSVSNQNTVFFRPKSKSINSLYLAALLRSSYFEQLLSSELRRSTTTLHAIGVSDVRALRIPLPNLHIQKEIAELFLDVEEFKQVSLLDIESHQKISEISLLQALEG